jgi:hypothetical protein
MKAPNSKLQAPEKFQAPNSFGATIWSLLFGASLELGAWNLVLFRHE